MLFIPGSKTRSHLQTLTSSQFEHNCVVSDLITINTPFDPEARLIITGDGEVVRTVGQFRGLLEVDPTGYSALLLDPYTRMGGDIIGNYLTNTDPARVIQLAEVMCDSTVSHTPTSSEFCLCYRDILLQGKPDWKLFAVTIRLQGAFLHYTHRDKGGHEIIFLNPLRLPPEEHCGFTVTVPLSKAQGKEVGDIAIDKIPLRTIYITLYHPTNAQDHPDVPHCYCRLRSDTPQRFAPIAIGISNQLRKLLGGESAVDAYFDPILKRYECQYFQVELLGDPGNPQSTIARHEHIFHYDEGKSVLQGKALLPLIGSTESVLSGYLNTPEKYRALGAGILGDIREELRPSWSITL